MTERTEITLEELADLPEGTRLLIDTRDEISMSYGTIPGAKHIPDLLEQAERGTLPKDRSLILFCMHGTQSLALAENLQDLGYQAFSLKNGYGAWLRKNLTPADRSAEIENAIRRVRRFHEKLMTPFTRAVKEYQLLQPGDRVYITCHADPVFDEAVVISGGGRPDYGPLLLLDGKKADITQVQELDARKEYFYSHHARTIAARRADGSWFFVVIEGYRAGSYGMQLDWAQTLLLDLGAQDAVNLDGGPSATMVTPSQLSGQPFTRSDNSGGSRTETRVGNALILTEEAH